MSEKLQSTNPIIDEAVDLRKAHQDAPEPFEEKKFRNSIQDPDFVVLPSPNEVLKQDRHDAALWRAHQHYQAHKEVYQDHAVADANAAGVETSFASHPPVDAAPTQPPTTEL